MVYFVTFLKFVDLKFLRSINLVVGKTQKYRSSGENV